MTHNIYSLDCLTYLYKLFVKRLTGPAVSVALSSYHDCSRRRQRLAICLNIDIEPMLVPPASCCKECGHKPPPDARFCDQCGLQVIADPVRKTNDNIVSLSEDLHMSTLLLHADFDAVFQRMREAKRTSKSLSALFRSIATQEQKQSMELKKGLSSLSCNERESKTLCDYTTHLSSNLEKQGRLSLMFSDCLLEEVANSLNQLRLQLKEHHKAALDAYNRALKALSSSDSAIQKQRDKLVRLEKQSTATSSPMKSNDRLAQTISAVNSDLNKAVSARETCLQALKTTKVSILKEWEAMEQSRLAIIVDRIERALVLQGSLLRQKVAFTYDLQKKLKSVSTRDDIQCWLQKYAMQAPLAQSADSNHTFQSPASQAELSAEAAPQPTSEKEALTPPQQASEKEALQMVKTLFSWIPRTESQSWPLLSPTLLDAKLIALCLYYRGGDPVRQKFCRRDLRVLLGIRDSMLDWALAALDRAERQLSWALRDSPSDQRRFLCVIAAGQLSDQASLMTLQSIMEREGDSNMLEGLDLTSLDSFKMETAFNPCFLLTLYRALFTAIIDDGGVAYLSEPAEAGSTIPTVFEDWPALISHFDCFRCDWGISESDHAAVWLHCLRFEVLALLPKPCPHRKLDIAEITSEATVAVINDAIKTCLGLSEPTKLLTTVIRDFKEWLNTMLACYFCLWPNSMLLIRTWSFQLNDDEKALQDGLLQAGFSFYGYMRDQTTELNPEFLQAISSEIHWRFSQHDQDILHPDLERFQGQLKSLIWADLFKQVSERPGLWETYLDLVYNDYLWDSDAAHRLVHDQLTLWLQGLEAQLQPQIEKMLLVDSRTPISDVAPFSSSAVDLFSSLNAALDVFERWLPSLNQKQVTISDCTFRKLSAILSSAIGFYLNAILSSSQPTKLERESKTQLQQQQGDYNELINQAMTKLNTKAKIMNLTKSVMKLAQRANEDPNVSTSVLHAMFPFPVATSTRSISELIVSLNNCRQVAFQSSRLNERLRSLTDAVDLKLDLDGSLKSTTSELSCLVANRLVFHELQHLIMSVYNPSPSHENSFSSAVLKAVDDFMAHIYSSLHENLFKSMPMFQSIVTDVFSSLLTAFLWIISAGAGDRVYQDVDYSLLNEDLHSMQNLFDSELPDHAKCLMDPVTAHLELMALSSNEILEECNANKLSKYNAALVLTKRTDQIATNWIKSQSKLSHKPR